jgi:hypothetical protein
MAREYYVHQVTWLMEKNEYEILIGELEEKKPQM